MDASYLEALALPARESGRNLIAQDAESLADRVRQSAFYVAFALGESIEAVGTTLDRIEATRRDGDAAVAAEVEQLKSWEQRLMNLAEAHGLERAVA